MSRTSLTTSSEMKSMHEQAAREANHTGKIVHCNGINYIPNKPRDKVADIGFIFLWISVVVVVTTIILSLLAMILSYTA